jgi:hypothetical protein
MKKTIGITAICIFLILSVACQRDNYDAHKYETSKSESTEEYEEVKLDNKYEDEALVDRYKWDMEYFAKISDSFVTEQIEDTMYLKNKLFKIDLEHEIKTDISEIDRIKVFYPDDEELSNDVDILVGVYSDYDNLIKYIKKYNLSKSDKDLEDVKSSLISFNMHVAMYHLQVDALDGSGKSLNQQQDEALDEYNKNMEENRKDMLDLIDNWDN